MWTHLIVHSEINLNIVWYLFIWYIQYIGTIDIYQYRLRYNNGWKLPQLHFHCPKLQNDPDWKRYLIFSFLCNVLLTFVSSFDHCIVCPSSMYGFWLPLCYLQTFDHCIVCPSSMYGFWLLLCYLQTVLIHTCIWFIEFVKCHYIPCHVRVLWTKKKALFGEKLSLAFVGSSSGFTLLHSEGLNLFTINNMAETIKQITITMIHNERLNGWNSTFKL